MVLDAACALLGVDHRRLSELALSAPAGADAPVNTAPQAAPSGADPAQVPEALDPLADLIAQSAQTLDEEAAETADAPALTAASPAR